MSTAVCFARRVSAGRVLLFHHDPLHSDDALDRMRDQAVEHWSLNGGEAAQLELAAERREIALGEPVSSSAR